MRLTFGFVISAFLASPIVASPSPSIIDVDVDIGLGKPLKRAGLHELARRKGRYVGTATDKWILDQDAPYAAIAESEEFGQVTPENTMKWETIEPQPGVFNFTPSDALVAWARRHNRIVRGHTLVWHSQLAPWVEGNNYTAAELKVVLKRHVQTVARHFRGKIAHWDVVNEVFNDDGTLRNSVFSRAFGEDFIRWAFEWAHEADPFAKLYITDYNFESATPKTDAVTALVKKLKRAGVPVHGIGAQNHHILGRLSDTMLPLWKKWSDELKVDIAVAELDIRMELPVTPEKLAQQAADYETVTRNCLAVRRCVGITLWQYTDKYSWVPGWFEGQGAPLPWGEQLEKKPAYDAMKRILAGRG